MYSKVQLRVNPLKKTHKSKCHRATSPKAILLLPSMTSDEYLRNKGNISIVAGMLSGDSCTWKQHRTCIKRVVQTNLYACCNTRMIIKHAHTRDKKTGRLQHARLRYKPPSLWENNYLCEVRQTVHQRDDNVLDIDCLLQLIASACAPSAEQVNTPHLTPTSKEFVLTKEVIQRSQVEIIREHLLFKTLHPNKIQHEPEAVTSNDNMVSANHEHQNRIQMHHPT